MYEIEPRYNDPRFNNLSNTISLSYYPKPFGRKDGIKVKQVTYSAVRSCCFNAPSKFSENSQILSPYIKIHKFSGLQETKFQPPSRLPFFYVTRTPTVKSTLGSKKKCIPRYGNKWSFPKNTVWYCKLFSFVRGKFIYGRLK